MKNGGLLLNIMQTLLLLLYYVHKKLTIVYYVHKRINFTLKMGVCCLTSNIMQTLLLSNVNFVFRLNTFRTP